MPDTADDDIRRWVDTAAITDLIYRYADRGDAGNWADPEFG